MVSLLQAFLFRLFLRFVKSNRCELGFELGRHHLDDGLGWLGLVRIDGLFFVGSLFVISFIVSGLGLGLG